MAADNISFNVLKHVLVPEHHLLTEEEAEAVLQRKGMTRDQLPKIRKSDPGIKILENVREWSQMPIIVVSARTHEKDKVEALDKGADDYIAKPFGTSELLARVRTAIRHARGAGNGQGGTQAVTFLEGRLVIDHDKHRVFVDGEDAGLTQNEFKLVSLLGKYAGKVLTYDYMMKEIWGPNMKNDNRILRVNMANIRRKIEKNPAQPEFIFTEIGVGYRFVEADVQAKEKK